MDTWSSGAWLVAGLLAGVILGALIGAVIGALIATMRTRQKMMAEQEVALRNAVDTAVDQAVAQTAERERERAAATVAVLEERSKALLADRDEAQQSLASTREEFVRMRDMLDTVRDDRAQLAERAAQLPVAEQALAEARQRIETLHETVRTIGERAASLEADNARLPMLSEQLDATRRTAHEAQSQVAELQTRLDAERQQSEEKLALLTGAREQLSNQFKALANDILEEKSKRFTEQNQTNLGQLLDPLRTRLHEFQGKVEQFYVNEGQQRSALEQQVKQLLQLNQMLSDDAKNLTQALKGSAKAQGNWGELILERVLEASGLRRGMEYDVQESHVREDGSRVQPDVVIHLPENRHLVVDAKVSLIAYDEFVNSADDGSRVAAQRRHVESVMAHIKELSDKNYQQLYGLQSLDFVLMFVPIEPAFMQAIAADKDMFMSAWNRNVLLVSPSTLLFVVRTVAHLWRQEAQTRNAQEIAKRGAELYDRLAAFTTDLDKLGDRLRLAQESYTSAYDKLARNRGNVIRQAEMLKTLGVKPTKRMPKSALESGQDEENGSAGDAEAETDSSLPPLSLDVADVNHTTDGGKGGAEGGTAEV